MKYEIKRDGNDTDDDFEIIELKIIRERTRARLASWVVGVWLLVVVVRVTAATLTHDHAEIQKLLDALTPLVMMAFGIYLGQVTTK